MSSTPLIPAAEQREKKNLTEDERRKVLHLLLQNAKDGVLKHGAITEISKHLSCHVRIISRIWKTTKEQMQLGEQPNIKSKMFGKCGRKKHEVSNESMSAIPYHKRQTYRSLACSLETNKSTLHRLGKEGKIKSHSSAIKPYLTIEHQRRRLEFSLSMIVHNVNLNPSFNAMYDTIHIDEKWFLLTKTSQKYYLHSEECDPYRTCKSKRFIPKVMFMAAVARPRISSDNTVLFDGKIGIFPFIYQEPARRKSKNRAAGVMETKPIVSINKEVIKKCLIEDILPAIKLRWPVGASKRVVIQQDNARTHLDPNDPDWVDAATKDGWDIKLTCQPAKSPDLNILDLGFFRAIQSLQQEKCTKNVDELLRAVKEAFDELQASTLNKVWLSLQLCMCEVIRAKGSNNYKIPHIGKDRLFRQGTLPTVISVDHSFFVQRYSNLEEMVQAGTSSHVAEHNSLEDEDELPN